MNAEIFAEWMRLQDRQVIRTQSSYWYEAGPRVFQAFPLHWEIQPSKEEIRDLLVRNGALSARYSKPLNSTEGMMSYHAVLCPPYDLKMLRHQARNGIRKGLKCFQIERISFHRLAEEGWNLQKDTLERQGRAHSMEKAEWERICRAADGLPGFEAWGAVCYGELAGSLLTTRVDDTCYMPYAQSHREFLNDHVNNALFYTVCCDMLSRSGVAGIFFSLHSLDAPSSVDDFKWRMGFIAKPVRQQVVFHPWLDPFANRLSHAVVLRLLKRYRSSPLLSKAEGMLRFKLEGKKPLDEQAWPDCLKEYRVIVEKSNISGDGKVNFEPTEKIFIPEKESFEEQAKLPWAD